MPAKNRKQVLEDHTRIGKRFVPPILGEFASIFHEVPWVNLVLPEVIWIAELEAKLGLKRGTELACTLSTLVSDILADEKSLFIILSDYFRLSGESKNMILSKLEEDGNLSDLKSGLIRLQALYPDSPFGFLFNESDVSGIDKKDALSDFKEGLASLFDKTTKEAIFVQGTAIYMVTKLGKLYLQEGSSLSALPSLEDYPKTERLREVAAEVRSLIPMLFVQSNEPDRSKWANYFWNRGLVLEKCMFPDSEGGG
ncbi:MAG: hypothetical protein IH971_07520 [Candidatus Marinimicrobia bacterium]|nr:hypothetical protein [Candidatus Neomarinimicrobiota bacterium]